MGHFEECVRREGSTTDYNKFQRYTINVAKAGADLGDLVSGLETKIQTLDPKAIDYLIGEEDYLQGAEGLSSFIEDLKELLRLGLSMKDGQGCVVLQLPHAVTESWKNSLIEDYRQAVADVLADLSDDEAGRVKVVDHYEQTRTDTNFTNGTYLTEEGRLNANGHLAIARQLCLATIGHTKNVPSSLASWTANTQAEEYVETLPTVKAGVDSLQVEVPDEAGTGCSWELELEDMTISGQEEENSFTITNLPARASYRLTVYSKDKTIRFSSVYGEVKEGSAGNTKQLEGVQQEIQEKLESGEALTWLFMGDSITHGLAHTVGYDSISQIFTKYVKEDLGRTEDVVINTGVSGTDTEWTLENIVQRATKYDPDIVSIMLGTNDVYTNVLGYHTDSDGNAIQITTERYRQNLENVEKALRQVNPDVTIIFRSPTPTTQGQRDTYLTTGGYLQVMEEVAKEDGNILYIDQYHEWDQELRSFTYLWGKNYYFNDGNLHPNAAGQQRMFVQFLKETGLDTDTRLANLSYKLPYTEDTSSVIPEVTTGNHKLKVSVSQLQQDYASAGGSGQIGGLTITLTDADGKTYTQSSPAGGGDFVMKGIPYGTYQVQVTGTRSDSAVHVTFASQTVELGASYAGTTGSDESQLLDDVPVNEIALSLTSQNELETSEGVDGYDLTWNTDGSGGTCILYAKEGYAFLEDAKVSLAGDVYEVESTWKNDQVILVTLKKIGFVPAVQETEQSKETEKSTEGAGTGDKQNTSGKETEKQTSTGNTTATGKLTAVKNFKAKAAKGKVKLTWKKVAGAKTYIIYRSTKKNKGYVKIGTVKGGAKASYIDKKAKKGKRYYYRIVAKTSRGKTPICTSKAVKIK
jgi:lysophospholipase L1-like esterase